MSQIGVLYFSGYGHAARLAEAVERGAASQPGAQVCRLRISDTGELPPQAWASLSEADAIVYGSPTYMGGPAWQFKRVAEASSKLWLEQAWRDKLAAGFTVSAATNGDKYLTIQYFWTLSQQHSQVWVGTGLLPSNALAHTADDINWSGGFTGVQAIAPADASPDQAPRAGDLAAAEALGARVALLAGRLRG
jgi:NAD(P)H dehydrogenase (quinone)